MNLFGVIVTLLKIINSQSDIVPLGGQRDDNNCLISAGYSWCEFSKSCIRQWETPCKDNYNDCEDCLGRQKNGENIACPIDCDLLSINNPCSFDCPPMFPCPDTGPDCEYIHEPKDNCGCIIGCGEINCSSHISIEGENCGGYRFPEYNCDDNLECVYINGPYIADAPGECKQICPSFRDQWGNCVDSNCNLWFDGCNTCTVKDNTLTSCTEQVCFNNNNNALCIDNSGINNIPANCATWFDGCNTCSVHNGKLGACTLMMCFQQAESYCMAFTIDTLNIGDICYRYCEDSSQSFVDRRSECPLNTDCYSLVELNQASMIAFDSCRERVKTCNPSVNNIGH